MSDAIAHDPKTRIWAQYGPGVLAEYVLASDYDRDLAEMRRQRDEAKARVALLDAELRAVLGDAPYIFSKRVASIVAALAAVEEFVEDIREIGVENAT